MHAQHDGPGQALVPAPLAMTLPSLPAVAAWVRARGMTLGPDGGGRADWDLMLRVLGITLGIAAAWVAGLVVLYAAGRVLGQLTLLWLWRDDPIREIPRWQRWMRRAYAVIIHAAALYYYISLVVIVGALLAVACGVLVYGLSSEPVTPGSTIGLVVPLTLAVTFLVVPLLRTAWPRFSGLVPGRPLRRDEAPALWGLTREVADRVGTRPVDDIRLTMDAEIGVIERGLRHGRRCGPSRRILILGLGALDDDFAPDAFRAVLAHEYAHLHHGDTAGGELALRVQAAIQNLGSLLIQQGRATIWNVDWQFVRAYFLLFQRLALGAARLKEVHADLLAARTYGGRAAEAGLLHMVRRDFEFRREFTHAFQDTFYGPRRRYTPHRSRDAMERRLVAAQLRLQLQTPTSGEDSHPGLAERLRLCERVRAAPDTAPPDPPEDGTTSVWELFADPEQIRAEYRRRFDAEVQNWSDLHVAHQDRIIAGCDAAIAADPESATPYFFRALAHHELGDDRAAVADYTEVIAREPGAAVAYFRRGEARFHLGEDEAAIEDYRTAIRLDPFAAEAAACVAIGDIHALAGDDRRAIAEYSRSLELYREQPGVLLRRGNARLRGGDPAGAVEDFHAALQVDPELAEALVTLGRAHRALGAPALARADAERALAIDSRLDEAHALLARLLLDANDPGRRDLPRPVAHARRACRLTGEADAAAVGRDAAVTRAARAPSVAREAGCDGGSRLDRYRAITGARGPPDPSPRGPASTGERTPSVTSPRLRDLTVSIRGGMQIMNANVCLTVLAASALGGVGPTPAVPEDSVVWIAATLRLPDPIRPWALRGPLDSSCGTVVKGPDPTIALPAAK